MNKTKIAVIDMQPIDPPVGGGRIRLLGLYSGMDESIDVTYVGTFDWRGPKARRLQISSNLTEIDIPLSEEHFAENDKLTAILGKNVIDCAFPIYGGLSTDYINKCCEEAKKADIVIFSHPWLFTLIAPVLDAEKQLIVHDSHNCEGLLREKLLDDGSAKANEIIECVVREEYEACRAADVILACSQEDKNSYVNLYGIEPDKIFITPNAVFSRRILPPSKEEKKAIRKAYGLNKPSLCFIGSNYDPNYEAVNLIIEAAEYLPDLQFIVMGGVCQRFEDQRDMYDNIRFTGFLEEAEKIDYLRACDIAINPMISGSGTNIKMFDFMAAGLPIITTDIGARGIDNTNGRVYLKCSHDAKDLAESIRKLLADKELAQTLSVYGRKEAENRYSWEKISLELGKILAKAYQRKINATEKVLMVSTYPPEKCGIGKYAEQQTEYLRMNGSNVDVMAILGNGKYQMAFRSAEDILKLKEYKELYDRIIIQYHASFFYSGADREEIIRRHKAFAEVLKDNPNIEIVCHEITFSENWDRDVRIPFSEAKYKKEKWLSAAKLIFHTEKERTAYCKHMGISIEESHTELISPHQYYVKKREISQCEAREELGIPTDATIFLCIGFIQPHKAFDVVAEQFQKIQNPTGNKKLYIVGSIRYICDETMNYLKKLQSYDNHNTINIITDYVSDEIFDTWLLAADYVITPYKEIWSSGVLGRAKLFEKKCIARNVGGLSEQLVHGDIMFDEYEELVEIIEKAE